MAKELYDFYPSDENKMNDDLLKCLLINIYRVRHYDNILDFIRKMAPGANKNIHYDSIKDFLESYKRETNIYPRLYDIIKGIEAIINSDNKYKLVFPLELLEMYLDCDDRSISYAPDKLYSYFKYDEDFILNYNDFILKHINVFKDKIPKSTATEVFREINNVNKDEVELLSLKRSNDLNLQRRTKLIGVSVDNIIQFNGAFDFYTILRDKYDTIPKELLNDTRFLDLMEKRYYGFYLIQALSKRIKDVDNPDLLKDKVAIFVNKKIDEVFRNRISLNDLMMDMKRYLKGSTYTTKLNKHPNTLLNELNNIADLQGFYNFFKNNDFKTDPNAFSYSYVIQRFLEEYKNLLSLETDTKKIPKNLYRLICFDNYDELSCLAIKEICDNFKLTINDLNLNKLDLDTVEILKFMLN